MQRLVRICAELAERSCASRGTQCDGESVAAGDFFGRHHGSERRLFGLCSSAVILETLRVQQSERPGIVEGMSSLRVHRHINSEHAPSEHSPGCSNWSTV